MPAPTPTRRALDRPGKEIQMEYDPDPPTHEEVAEGYRFKYEGE